MPHMQTLATATVVVAALYLTVCLAGFARKKPGYAHRRHTISELGEVGAPHQRVLALGVFLPVGLLLLVAAYLLQPVSAAEAVLALCISIGYLVAAAFPCDPGSPVSGSARQAVHNLGGAVEYIGGGAALLALNETHGLPFKAAAFIVFGATALLTVLPTSSVRGIVQRVAEVCLFAGLVVAASRASGGA